MEVVAVGKLTLVDSTPPLDGAAIDVQSLEMPALPEGPTQLVPLGVLFGTRSGDKGPNANLGIFARSPEAYVWLENYLSIDMLKQLMPEAAERKIDRYELPNLLSLNFIFQGLLEEGVAASTRQDPQAKALGEYLRAKLADIPEMLLS